MRTRPHRGLASDKETGFTLVEVLAVLIIIGLMSSIVILSIPTPKSALEKQTQVMVGSLNELAQNSIINGRVSAAGFSQSGYTLYEYDQDEWQELASDEWDAGYRLQYKRADTRLDLPKTSSPSILFQPTGLSTPFELAMSNNDIAYTLMTTGDGRIVLQKNQ